jgi:hypothetical protein
VARNGGAGQRYVSNFPADATIDEVMTFLGTNEEGIAAVMNIWREGRFYKSYGAPDKSGGGTLANFTSARVKFRLAGSRVNSLVPRGAWTTAPAPGVAPPPPMPPSSSGAANNVRLGLVVYNLRTPDYVKITTAYPSGLPSGKVPQPKVYFDILDADSRSSLMTGAAVLGTDPSMSYFTLGGGAITVDGTADGKPIDVDPTKDIRYRFWMDSGLPLNFELQDPYTASPLMDDVIVTYARARPEILSWTVAY